MRVVDPAGSAVVEHLLVGAGPPGIAEVAIVARLALRARRLGADVVVEEASTEMVQLLELAGLPVEVAGQPEGRKQALGIEEVEEEAQGGDPPL